MGYRTLASRQKLILASMLTPLRTYIIDMTQFHSFVFCMLLCAHLLKASVFKILQKSAENSANQYLGLVI